MKRSTRRAANDWVGHRSLASPTDGRYFAVAPRTPPMTRAGTQNDDATV